MNRRTIATIGVAGALALGAIPALAQDDAETPTEDTTTDQDTTRAALHEERQAAFAEALAAELDLPVEQVTEALTTVREELRAEHQAARAAQLQERLDAAVEAGELTQEQADAIAAAAEAGVLRGPRGHRGAHGPRGAWGAAAPSDAA